MDTIQVKALLFKAMKNPTKKAMTTLAESVIELCDNHDKANNLTAIIKESREGMNDTANLYIDFISKLRSK